MRRRGPNEYHVIGCVPFQEGQPGFALPLFADPTNPNLCLVQEVDELLGTIAGYKILDGDLSSSGVIALTGPVARIGGDVVYAFITSDGAALAGTLIVLKSVLKNFISQNPERRAVILQIQELIGTDQEKKFARVNMRDFLRRSSGARSARSFYEGSVLQSALWQHLLSLAPDDTFAERILALRSKLSAELELDGTIKLDLTALGPSDMALVDEAEIIARLVAEFETSDQSTLLVNAPEDFIDVTRSMRTREVIERMRRTGRQEERIAILADAILLDRDSGLSALIEYGPDRAAVANWALGELRSKLTGGSSDRGGDEYVIADLIPRMFTYEYPLNRGYLLYALAKHLTKWPIVNKAIRGVLDRTHSFVVDQYRKQIERLLAEA